MVCKNCGAIVLEDDRFCSQCGEPVDNPAEEELSPEIDEQIEITGFSNGESEFIPDFMPDEIQNLSREDTMEVLRQVKEIAIEAEGYEIKKAEIKAAIAKVCEKAEEIRKKNSPEADDRAWKITLAFVFFGFLYGVYITFFDSSFSFSVLDIFFAIIIILVAIFGGFIVGYLIGSVTVLKPDLERHAEENNAEADQYIHENTKSLEEDLDMLLQEQEYQNKYGKIAWAIDVVGEDMFYSKCISDLYDLIKSRKADNLKEALNKYDDEQHKQHMEEIQKAIQNASEISAEESVKQTAQMSNIEKNTHQAATAAKMTAANTYGTYRKTKKIEKTTRKINKKL